MLMLYRLLTVLATPIISHWLGRRQRAGKEHPARMQERWGYASQPRPEGTLIWIHAASVGEFNAALPIIDAVLAANTDVHVLITTGTLTSAVRAEQMAQARMIHQFVPVDTPSAVNRFLEHWKPTLAIWMESELWPNLITQAKKCGIAMLLVNARLSEKSMRQWKKMRSLFLAMTQSFDAIIAASTTDAQRYRSLGATDVQESFSIKYDAAPPVVNAIQLSAWQQQLSARPVWLAASTHPGEEEIMLQAHQQLQKQFPDVLSVIVPRHPSRGGEVAKLCLAQSQHVAQCSKGDSITPDISVLIGDVMGEMGTFYRLCPIVLVAGSLVPHGGHNPIEPAQFGCAIMVGEHMFHFADMAEQWKQEQALVQVQNAKQMAQQIADWLSNEPSRTQAAHRATLAVAKRKGALDKVMQLVSHKLNQQANQSRMAS